MWDDSNAGLILGPSQVRGAFRLVPLLRERCRTDLRLGLVRQYGVAATVKVGTYCSYMPHAMIAEWTADGTPVATLGTQLKNHRNTSEFVGVFQRMAKRQEGNRLRFLPLHLAMEGFMAQHFGGPKMQWGYFSRRAVAEGFSPRCETSVPGHALLGFEEALRVFEIHHQQVGVLVFVAEALAAAFVTPHWEDYRLLHDSLLEDFFGDLLWQYAVNFPHENNFHFPLNDDAVRTLADLRHGMQAMRQEWAEFGQVAASGLSTQPHAVEQVYQAGPFRLERFVGNFDPAAENHIGERIVAEDETLQYLKTYRLSAAQTRRAFMIKQLADHDWNIDAIAAKLNTTPNQILLRYEQQGFGWLFHQHVMDAARAEARRKK